jgi:hypothetical protein
LLLWPPLATTALLEEWHSISSVPLLPEGSVFWQGALTWGTAALGIWWTILGLLAAWFPGAPRALFYPFLEGLGRRHGVWLVLAGLALAAVGLAVGLSRVPLTLP